MIDPWVMIGGVVKVIFEKRDKSDLVNDELVHPQIALSHENWRAQFRTI